MNKSVIKSIICLLLAFVMFASTVVTAFADVIIENCYTADNTELLQEYADAYGWDMAKMMAKSWSDNDEEYERQVGGQREYLSDCFSGTDDFLMSEAEFDENGNIILAGNKDATIKFLEDHDIPLDSINSGTLIYGSGGQNIVAVALAEVGRADSVEQPPHSNSVKYNKWYYGRDERAAWCVVFIMWCAAQAGCSDVFPRTANTDALGNGMVKKGYKYFHIKDCTPLEAQPTHLCRVTLCFTPRMEPSQGQNTSAWSLLSEATPLRPSRVTRPVSDKSRMKVWQKSPTTSTS